MSDHLKIGKIGEDLALAHLIREGYEILATNWRHKRLEVDIIAKDAGVLVFVEVKTRSYDYFGRPEEFVSPAKERNLAIAAGAYMEMTGYQWAIRFDVVAVSKAKQGHWETALIKDAFFPGIT